MDSVINKLKNEFELKCKTFQDKIHSYEKDKQKYENSCLPNVNTKDEADVSCILFYFFFFLTIFVSGKFFKG